MSKLVICEKYSVAANVAAALGATNKGDWFEGNGYIISWCVGHLVELASPGEYGEQYEKWSYESLPIMPTDWKYNLRKDTKEQYEILKRLMDRSDVTSLVNCCDAGREGEMIFRLVYEKAGCKKEVERAWISSMEKIAIEEGFSNLRPSTEYDALYESGKCRQRADWLVGMNGTRLFTVLYRNKVLKVGRVQTPTLAMMVDREMEITNFKKTPFYSVELSLGNLKASSEKFKEKEAAEKLLSICGERAFVKEYKSTEKNVAPPHLYDLNSLQVDAYNRFKFTADKTLNLAQSLYEKKLITYPRADSKYLTNDMREKALDIIQLVKNSFDFLPPFEADFPVLIDPVLDSKKVSDHHAIIPTAEFTKHLDEITEDEKKLLTLIACRMLCATGEKHTYISDVGILECEGYDFKITGKHVKYSGWKFFEDAFLMYHGIRKEESEDDTAYMELHIGEGEILAITDKQVKVGSTKPPLRFTDATILQAMEKAGAKEMDEEVERKGLGTPATRASIIEKLVKDGFAKRAKDHLVPTEDGMKLITILPDVVKSPSMTADWENKLVLVSRGEADPEEFMRQIEEMVTGLIQTYHSISEEDKKNYFAKEQESYGKCPNCGKDVVKGKFGFYCSGKCGMMFGKAMGVVLTEKEVKDMLAGKKVLLKNLRNKAGKVYDAYVQPVGVEAYAYTDKEGISQTGYQYKYELSFPKKRKSDED